MRQRISPHLIPKTSKFRQHNLAFEPPTNSLKGNCSCIISAYYAPGVGVGESVGVGVSIGLIVGVSVGVVGITVGVGVAHAPLNASHCCCVT